MYKSRYQILRIAFCWPVLACRKGKVKDTEAAGDQKKPRKNIVEVYRERMVAEEVHATSSNNAPSLAFLRSDCPPALSEEHRPSLSPPSFESPSLNFHIITRAGAREVRARS